MTHLRSLVLILFMLWLAPACGVSLSAQPYDYLEFFKGTRAGLGTAANSTQCCIKDMVTDNAGNVYVVGYGISAETTPGSYQPTRVGGCNVYVAKYNSTLTTLIWGTFIGGNNDQVGSSIAVTPSGDVVICGVTSSTVFPVTNISDQAYLDGSNVNFVARLNSTGSRLVYCRVYARGYNSAPYYTDDEVNITANLRAFGNIVCTPNDEAWVVSSTSRNYYCTSNAYQSTLAGNIDLCLTKLDNTGTIQYSTYIGGTNNDDARGITYNNSKVYISARSNSPTFPLARNRQPDASGDGVFMVWNDGSTPTPVGSYLIGGSNYDDLSSLSFSASTLRVLIVGRTSSADFPATGSLQRGDVNGGFIISIAPDFSSIAFATLIGSNLKPHGVKARIGGDAVILSAMMAAGASIPVTPNAIKPTSTSLDQVITVLGSDGTAVRYGTYLGGNGSEGGTSLALIDANSCNYKILTASMTSTSKDDFPVSAGAFRGNICDCYCPGISILRTVHPDTFKIVTKPGCGEYQFEGTISPFATCPLNSIVWYFDDMGAPFTAGQVVTHRFPKNGAFTARMIVVYSGGDTVTFEKTVTVNTYPVITATPKSLYRCSNDNGVLLSATGGVRYVWRPAQTLSDSAGASVRAKPDKNTTYYVRGFNADGCWIEDSVQVYVLTAKATVTADTTVCNGSPAILRAAGGGVFVWSPSATLNRKDSAVVTARPTATTTYTVAVYEGSCVDTARVTVRVANKPLFILPDSPIICQGGSVELPVTITGTVALDTTGLSFSWSPASSLTNPTSRSPIASPTTTTDYTCTVRNAYGCELQKTIRVRVLTALELQLSPDTLTCRGSSLFLRAGGGAKYAWSPRTGLDDSSSATPKCTPTQRTTYTVMTWSGDFRTATCRDTATMTVDVYDIQPVKATGDTTVCPQSEVELRVANPDSTMQYEWRSASGNVLGTGSLLRTTALNSMRVIVQASTIQGCTSQDSVSIIVDSRLPVQAAAVAKTLAGTVITLRALAPDPSVSYEWSDINGNRISDTDTAQVTAADTVLYVLHGKRGGCEGRDTVRVIGLRMVAVDAGADTIVCRGSAAMLRVRNAQSGYSYEWYSVANESLSSSDSLRVVVNAPAAYRIVSRYGGYETDDTVRVQVFTEQQLVTTDTTVCENHDAHLNAQWSIPLRSAVWTDPAGTIVASTVRATLRPGITTRYTLTAQDTNGCVAIATQTISIAPAPRLLLRIEAPDSVSVWDSVEVRLVGVSTPDVDIRSLQCEIHIGKALWYSPQATYTSTEAIHTLRTAGTIGSTPLELGRVGGRICVSDYSEDLISIRNIVSDLDTTCVRIETQSMPLRVRSVCGNSMYLIQLTNDGMMIAPHPAHEHIDLRSDVPVRELALFTIPGEVIASKVPVSAAGVYSLPVPNIPPGIYALRVTTDAGIVRRMVVIE